MSVSIPNMAPWQGASVCTGSPTPGAQALMAYWLESFPGIASSMGIYNCRSVRGSATTSLHGEGRAADLGTPTNPRGKEVMYSFLSALAPHAFRFGIQCVIFDRTIWSAVRPARGSRYNGVHPHYDHAHVELTWNSARNLNLATLRAVAGDWRELQTEDDVYVVRFGQGRGQTNGDPRVKRAMRVLNAAAKAAWDKDLLPRFGEDGIYGDEFATAVNYMAQRAKLPQTGRTGMDVLVLDYCRNWLGKGEC